MNSPTDPPDSTPFSTRSGTEFRTASSNDRFDRSLWYTIGGIVLVSCCGLILITYLLTKEDNLKRLTTVINPPTPTPYPTSTPTQTSVPTITPTPHVYFTPVPGDTLITDNFNTNQLEWDTYFSGNTAEVRDGRLFIKSDQAGYIGMAICRGCPDFDKAFYFQAEIVPERITSTPGGLTFCVSRTAGKFYTFMVNPANSTFSLQKAMNNTWQDLIPVTLTDMLNTYPATNTLGVFYDRGTIKLYINEHLVTSITDPEPLFCKWVGVMISNSPVEMTADNFFAYKVRPIIVPSSTP
jgi:hypothetical protein